MPNWCVNQIHVSGPDALDVQRLMTEPQTLLHYDATKAAVKMFLAGVGGLLKPTVPMSFDVYPELIAGIGESNTANHAFDAFVMLLNQKPQLTPEICLVILTLFEQTGLKQRYWGNLPVAARKKISPLLKNSAYNCAYDWLGIYFRCVSLDVLWAKLDVFEPVLPSSFSLSSLCPPNLLSQINGFNGHLLPGISSGYNDNCDRLGTKWEMVDVDVVESNDGFVKLEFDTAWSPAIPPMAELAARFPESVFTHYFVEIGCSFCGYVSYEDGIVQEDRDDSLVFSDEENDEGYHDLVGPDYLIENFDRYGG
ncbi:DUF1281 domain-containing protein [Vibrio scophthalmi]|uniref:Uncharacterized protein n=1 Tax=Vibrio scophthalmi TaxID=45658 RepID=A0A1C7FHL2_9VIBR|nr:DUF1281 domain-containing protein [Vibrio scophthalmi]ANU39412.1 hypothetical protein VSVS05_04377 [Vibrio scophthalmi]